MDASDREFKQILKGRTRPIASLANALRRTVRNAAPVLREQVLPGYARYWNKGVVICAITLHADHVNLQFYYGADLSDPRHLLTGTGKRLRHISLAPSKNLPFEELERMVRQAAVRETR